MPVFFFIISSSFAMDVEVLVAKIYERKPIWNKWDKQHANRNVVEKLWAEISQEMKLPGFGLPASSVRTL